MVIRRASNLHAVTHTFVGTEGTSGCRSESMQPYRAQHPDAMTTLENALGKTGNVAAYEAVLRHELEPRCGQLFFQPSVSSDDNLQNSDQANSAHTSLPDIYVALVEDGVSEAVSPQFRFNESSDYRDLGANFQQYRENLSVDGDSYAGDFSDDVSDFCSIGTPSPLLEPTRPLGIGCAGEFSGEPFDCLVSFQALALIGDQNGRADLSPVGVRSPSQAWAHQPQQLPSHLNVSRFVDEPVQLLNQVPNESQHLCARRVHRPLSWAAGDADHCVMSQAYVGDMVSAGDSLTELSPALNADSDYHCLLRTPPVAIAPLPDGSAPSLPTSPGGSRRVARPVPRSPAISPRFHPTHLIMDGGGVYAYSEYDAGLATPSAVGSVRGVTGLSVAPSPNLQPMTAGPASPASTSSDAGRASPLLPFTLDTKPAPYICQYPGCGKAFSRPYNLKSHWRTHTDERPFACDVCGQAFSRQHDMKRHAKLHLGIKPYTCQTCHRSFARMDALNRHMKINSYGTQGCSGLLSVVRPDSKRAKSADSFLRTR